MKRSGILPIDQRVRRNQNDSACTNRPNLNRYDSDKTKIFISNESGEIGFEDSIRNKIVCPLSGSGDAEPVEVSYAFKLLVDELLGLGIQTKFELKNKNQNKLVVDFQSDINLIDLENNKKDH